MDDTGGAETHQVAKEEHDPLSTLRTQFGLQNFRAGQLEAILSILKGRDTCILWATGSGKSITFMLPALHTNKISIVVSPLLSLINDQVKGVNQRIGREVAISFAAGNATSDTLQRIASGEALLFYVTPERLSTDAFLQHMLHVHQNIRNIALLAVDEAHFLSSQGFDFRPSYRNIASFRDVFPNVPIAALTASASPSIRKDIIATLKLKQPVIFTSSYDKPNLALAVKLQSKNDSIRDITRECSKDTDGATIVFTFTRKDAETLHKRISQEGKTKHAQSAQLYHGQVDYETRERVQKWFNEGQIKIVVATGSSFGVGIDIGDIRRVMILGFPKSFEDYYQQIGRAGRDGKLSHVTMFVSKTDHMVHLRKKKPTEKAHLQFDKQERSSLFSLLRFAKDRHQCRRLGVMKYWGQGENGFRCNMCDNCTHAR